MKSISTKFLLTAGALAVLFAAFDVYSTYTDTRKHVEELVDQQAALALEFDLAIRSYVAEEIRPVMEESIAPDEFIPETMSTSFVARSIFDKVRQEFPDYIIKFSSDNPRNPANQAGPDELRMIEYFNDHPGTNRWTGRIDLGGRGYIAHFSARRMQASCLPCHGRPEDAPASLVERYGATAGFNRPVGDVVALDTIAIPLDSTQAAMAAELASHSLAMLVGLVLLFGGVLLVFRLVVARRLAVIAEHFRAIAAQPDSASIAPVKVRHADEIGALAASFNILAERLRAAHVSLEERVAQRTEELAKGNERLRLEISERRRVEETLDTERKQLLSIFDGMDEVVYVADPNTYELLYMNNRARKRWGDGVGQKCHHVLQNMDSPCPFCTNDRIFGAHVGRPYTWELQNLVTRRWYRSVDRAIRWPDGRMVRFELGVDITDRKQTEMALAEAHRANAEEARKLRAMIEGMEEGVVVANADDVVTEVNTWFLKKVGLKREEIVGQSLWKFHPDTDGTARLRVALDAFRTGRSREQHVVNRELLGMQLSLRVQPIFEDDCYRGVILNVISVTDLVEARQAAEAAAHAKSAFLANMSHEIRTPMTAILGFTDILLARGRLAHISLESLEAAKTIKRNGEYLLGIINDILDLSKIEAGKMTVEQIPCSPCRIVAEVVSLARVRAEAKGLPFSLEYDGVIPETIQSDPTRLRQILINLVNNAIKFTEVGSVRLVARFVDDRSGPRMQFNVVDTGLGMTEEQVAELFQPFSQADASTTRRFGGTGLGLSISKRLTEMLGGDISVVKTQPGVGTHMRVTVATGPLDGVRMIADPLSATVVASTASKETPCAAQAALSGCRILLAEDGPDNQRLIAHVLKSTGAFVAVVENGQLAADAALAACQEGKPFDVILMDMQMPVMDGYEATRLLRQKGYDRPIIALTAHAMSGDRGKCLEAGCDDYASKPIDRSKLIETIITHLRRDCISAR
jgi:PAS domain S-box-containing protein